MLHPIDIIDVGTGALLDSLIDPNLQLINPVNMPHPVLDVVITGSSGNVYAWRPEVRQPDRSRGPYVAAFSALRSVASLKDAALVTGQLRCICMLHHQQFER